MTPMTRPDLSRSGAAMSPLQGIVGLPGRLDDAEPGAAQSRREPSREATLVPAGSARAARTMTPFESATAIQSSSG